MGFKEFAAQIQAAVQRARAEQAAEEAARRSAGGAQAGRRPVVAAPAGRPSNATLAAAHTARAAVANDARASAANVARIAAAGNLGRSPAPLDAGGMPMPALFSDVTDAPAPLEFDRGVLDGLPGMSATPQDRTLLTDFASAQGVLAGFVLSEALAPPIALRGPQPFDRFAR